MKSLVGIRSDPFRFVVEAGKVREFARATYDPGWTHHPPAVPATFPMAGVAEFERHFLFTVLRLDPLRCLNAGQEYRYRRPLRIGDELTCSAKVVEDYRKQGKRGGGMRFIVFEIEMREEGTAAIVLTSRATTVVVEGPT